MKIGVVVPAFNEEKLIKKTLTGIPSWVDHIIVIDDFSTDQTFKEASDFKIERATVKVIRLEKNQGVGGAILTGHQYLMNETESEINVVMAGDDQMDPKYLTDLLDPIVELKADYAKGNRMARVQYLKGMPPVRIFGNIVLSYLTKIVSGQYHVNDPQNGYTAISRKFLSLLPINKVKHRYEFENDMLVWSRILRMKVIDVPIPARYADENSNLRIFRFVPRILSYFLVAFMRRIFYCYFLFSEAVIGIFLVAGFISLLIGVIFGSFVAVNSLGTPVPTFASTVIPIILVIFGMIFMSIFFFVDFKKTPK